MAVNAELKKFNRPLFMDANLSFKRDFTIKHIVTSQIVRSRE